MKRNVRWLILLAVLAVAVRLAAEPDSWAAPGQSPERQTVPTRTPVASPTTPPPSPTKSPSSKKNPPPAPTVAPTPTPTPLSEVVPAGGQSEPLLPDAGGPSVRFQLGVAMAVAGFLAWVAVGRRG